jgi:hypothetical protein
VVTLIESTSAENIRGLFSLAVPGTSWLPAVLNKLLLLDVTVSISVSPFNVSQINRNNSFVAIGSPAFNAGSMVIQSVMWPSYGFANATTMNLPGLPQVTFQQSPTAGFLARLRYNDVWWFYAAGFNELGTASATIYLAKRWNHLLNTFGNEAFIVLLEAPSGDPHFPSVVTSRTL